MRNLNEQIRTLKLARQYFADAIKQVAQNNDS